MCAYEHAAFIFDKNYHRCAYLLCGIVCIYIENANIKSAHHCAIVVLSMPQVEAGLLKNYEVLHHNFSVSSIGLLVRLTSKVCERLETQCIFNVSSGDSAVFTFRSSLQWKEGKRENVSIRYACMLPKLSEFKCSVSIFHII